MTVESMADVIMLTFIDVCDVSTTNRKKNLHILLANGK